MKYLGHVDVPLTSNSTLHPDGAKYEPAARRVGLGRGSSPRDPTADRQRLGKQRHGQRNLCLVGEHRARRIEEASSRAQRSQKPSD